MSFLKTINIYRRKITRGMAKNIGRSKPGQFVGKVAAGEIKTVLINRPNKRLGNLLMLTPLVQELVANFPQCKIDLFVKGGLAPILFENYSNVDKIIRLPKKPFKELIKYLKVWITIRQKKYDLVINIDNVSSSGRISTKMANARYKFFGNENEDALLQFADATHMAKRPVYLLRENLILPVTGDGNYPVPALNIQLDEEEMQKGKKVLSGLFTGEKKIISLFTYATGAKCYSKEWWDTFYSALKNQFPGYDFVEILPAENVSQLDFRLPSFYSMDVREICAVIASTALFIGADSGMMHLAGAAKIPVIGLFSMTNTGRYQPYGSGSTGINTNEMDVASMIEVIKKISGMI